VTCTVFDPYLLCFAVACCAIDRSLGKVRSHWLQGILPTLGLFGVPFCDPTFGEPFGVLPPFPPFIFPPGVFPGVFP